MSKETAEIVTECWQLLVEYIPRREQAGAAEQLFTYLIGVLDKSELEAIADLDGDLADAYAAVNEEQDSMENEYDSYYNEDNDDE